MVDAWALRILVTVADHGSFSAAAEQLVLTQPAVSRQIATLERQWGVPLFRRHARGVTPTESGDTAVSLARGALARLDALDATMTSLAGLDGGRLRIAGFASINTHLVPEAIRCFDVAHPKVTVTLNHVEAFDALAAVRDGRVDLALVTEWQLVDDRWSARTDPDAVTLDPDDIDGLDLVPLLDESLQVALAADHRLAGLPRIPLVELRGERWVDGAPPDCLGALSPLTQALGAPPEIGFMCDDWNGKQALVAGGAGVMVVPSLAATALRPDVVLRPTTPRLPSRRLYAATSRPPYRTPPVSAMLAVLADVAARLDEP